MDCTFIKCWQLCLALIQVKNTVLKYSFYDESRMSTNHSNFKTCKASLLSLHFITLNYRICEVKDRILYIFVLLVVELFDPISLCI